jgi:CDP-diacylglycerol---glycerol-3-phosphate 3-phosphatidyltransferase
VQLGLANVWCVLIIIAREFMVTSIRLIAADNGVVIAANKWGKTKTVSQIIAIVAILVFQSIFEFMGAGPHSGVGMVIGGTAFGGFSVDVNAAFSLIGNVLLWIATFFAVLSGVIYLKQNSSVINTTK